MTTTTTPKPDAPVRTRPRTYGGRADFIDGRVIWRDRPASHKEKQKA